MRLCLSFWVVLLAAQGIHAQTVAVGKQPAESLGARDVATEFRLPPLKDRPKDRLYQQEAKLQVIERARLLGLGDRSAKQAWLNAESLIRKARLTTSNAANWPSPILFTGQLASELNKLLARPDVAAVQVVSAEVSLDEPILLTRSNVALDLGTAQLRATTPMPYMVRIERAHDVHLKGGAFVSGSWAVLIAACRHVDIRGMRLRDLTGGGILFTGTQDAVIQDATFHGLYGAAILLHGDTHRVAVLNNEILQGLGSSNWNAGIVLTDRTADLTADPDSLFNEDRYWAKEEPVLKRLHGPQDNVVADNTILGNASSGIYSDGSTKNVFVGNRIERNSKEGLCLDNGSTADVVAFNLFRANGDRWGKSDQELKLDFVAQQGRLPDGTSPAKVPGISVDNAAYNEIVFNQLDSNYGGGIKLVRTAVYNIIGLNTLTDNNLGKSERYHFFGIEAGAATADAPSPELDFAPSRGNQIFGNVIRGSHYAGIFFAAGSDQNDIFDNSIFGATNWAIESAVVQTNKTLNNLTNERSRNIDSGLDPALLGLGVGLKDTAPVPNPSAARPAQTPAVPANPSTN